MNSNAFQKSEDDKLKIAIKEEQLTVVPDTRATIHVGIVNESASEDYFDLMVKGVPPEWITVHTPVVHLAAGEAKLVTLTVQPPSLPDRRVVQYPLDVRVVSQSDPKRSAVARSVLTVAAYQSRGRIGVMLASIQFSVAPGSMIDIPVLLQNRGDDEDSFRLNVIGLPENWVSSNSPLTSLQPDTSAEIQLTLQVPRSSQAAAGRTPFTIQFASQMFPTQTVEVECILTIAAFSQFSVSLEPDLLQSGQPSQVIINNEGNTTDTYGLSFQSAEHELIFEKAVQVARPGPQAGTQQVEVAYVEIPAGESLQVPPGERGAYAFRVRLRRRLQLAPVDDVHRLRPRHHSDRRRRPRVVDVRAEVLRAHRVVRAAEPRVDVGEEEPAVRLPEALHVRRAEDRQRLRDAPPELDQLDVGDRHPLDRLAALRLDHRAGDRVQAAALEVAEDVDRELLSEAALLHERVGGRVAEEELELPPIAGLVDVLGPEALAGLDEDGVARVVGDVPRQPARRRGDAVGLEEEVRGVLVVARRTGRSALAMSAFERGQLAEEAVAPLEEPTAFVAFRARGKCQPCAKAENRRGDAERDVPGRGAVRGQPGELQRQNSVSGKRRTVRHHERCAGFGGTFFDSRELL